MFFHLFSVGKEIVNCHKLSMSERNILVNLVVSYHGSVFIHRSRLRDFVRLTYPDPLSRFGSFFSHVPRTKHYVPQNSTLSPFSGKGSSSVSSDTFPWPWHHLTRVVQVPWYSPSHDLLGSWVPPSLIPFFPFVDCPSDPDVTVTSSQTWNQ